MLIFSPIWPWSYIALIAAALAVAIMFLWGGVDRYRGYPAWNALAGSRVVRVSVLALSTLAAVFFSAAAMDPSWQKAADPARLHLQVVVDVSDSIMRSSGGWNAVHRVCSQEIEADVSSVPSKYRSKATAHILTFRGNTASAGSTVALEKLPELFARMSPGDFASGPGTHIENALDRAGQILDRSGGAGAVLLLSDGNQTLGNVAEAAQRLAARGIPIHVRPLTAGSPALAVTAANLPRHTLANVNTFLRGSMVNSQDKNENAVLSLNRNPGTHKKPFQFGPPLSIKKEITIAAGQFVRLRWPIIFQGCGLQFVDLSLLSDVKGAVPHLRRFFTHVNRPPRILAIGGDNRWVSAIPGDTAEIIQVTTSELDPEIHFQNTDAIVIGSVPAHEFHTQDLDEMAVLIKENGLGLMVINGDHKDADASAETVLMSYNDTALEELLPVKSGPRMITPEPPPRNVIILIDTSGSMGGQALTLARKIAAHIIVNLLRPIDRLDLITFTTGAGHMVKDTLMTEQGKKEAVEILNRIKAGGGTDPNRALELVRYRKLKSCGLIFISDGGFSDLNYRPDCRATVFAIGHKGVNKSSPLWKLADPIPAPYSFDPASIRIPYFKRKERKKYYEKGDFSPLSMERLLPKNERVPFPSLPMRGAAVSTLKDDTILNGVRPKLTDPILAYRRNGAGYVGVFTGSISGSWLSRPEGKAAVEAWMTHIVPYMARERYDFKLEDRGDAIAIRIALVPKNNRIPQIGRLDADIRFGESQPLGISLKADEASPGTFTGRIRVPRDESSGKGILYLKETGPDALARPQQVPIMVPPPGGLHVTPSVEAFSYGQNSALLSLIAECGGGMYAPPAGTSFFRAARANSGGKSLRYPLLALAALFYLAAILLARWLPSQ
ncbi:MAG: VWA domain-containing protein [bacterium]|nr:VWA domain-containing protein [bacterium]